MRARLLSFGSLFVLGSSLSCLGRAREEKPPEGLQSLADQLEEARENPDGASTGMGGATSENEPIETIVTRHNVPGADGSCPMGLDSLRPWQGEFETDDQRPALSWRYLFADACDNVSLVDGLYYRLRVLADGHLDWAVIDPFNSGAIGGGGVDHFGNLIVLMAKGIGILNAAGQPYPGLEPPLGLAMSVARLDETPSGWVLSGQQVRARIELPSGDLAWETEFFPDGSKAVDLLDMQHESDRIYRKVHGQMPSYGPLTPDRTFLNRLIKGKVVPHKDRTKYELDEETIELDNDYPLMSGQLLIDGDRTLLAVSYGTPWDSDADIPEETPQHCVSARLFSPEDPDFGSELDFCGYVMEMLRADDGGVLTLWGVAEPGPWLTLRPILLHHDNDGKVLNRWDLTETIGLGEATNYGYDFPKAFVMTKLSRGVAVGAFGETNDEVHLARIHVP